MAAECLRLHRQLVRGVPGAAEQAELRDALAVSRRIRDWLLDRAGVAAGEPGARVRSLGQQVIARGEAGSDDHVEERLLAAIQSRIQEVPLEETVVDYAAFQAGQLHSVAIVVELWCAFERFGLAELEEAAPADPAGEGYRPELVPIEGLFTRAQEILVNHLLVRAALLQYAGDARCLDVLARARAIDPRHTVVLGCYDEARFDRGDRDEQLLADLQEELRMRPSLPLGSHRLRRCDSTRLCRPVVHKATVSPA